MKIQELKEKEVFDEEDWTNRVQQLLNSLFDVKHIKDGKHDLFVGHTEIPKNSEPKTYLKNIYKIGNWGFDINTEKTFFTANIFVRNADHQDGEDFAKVYFFFPCNLEEEGGVISSQIYGLSYPNTELYFKPFLSIKEQLLSLSQK